MAIATVGRASKRFEEATHQLDHLQTNNLLAGEKGKRRGLGGGGPDPARDTPTPSLAAILIFSATSGLKISPKSSKSKKRQPLRVVVVTWPTLALACYHHGKHRVCLTDMIQLETG